MVTEPSVPLQVVGFELEIVGAKLALLYASRVEFALPATLREKAVT